MPYEGDGVNTGTGNVNACAIGGAVSTAATSAGSPAPPPGPTPRPPERTSLETLQNEIGPAAAEVNLDVAPPPPPPGPTPQPPEQSSPAALQSEIVPAAEANLEVALPPQPPPLPEPTPRPPEQSSLDTSQNEIVPPAAEANLDAEPPEQPSIPAEASLPAGPDLVGTNTGATAPPPTDIIHAASPQSLSPDLLASQTTNPTTSPIQPGPQLWAPVSFRWPTLLAFLVAFIALTITLQVLYRKSPQNHGFETTQLDFLYRWASTAVVTILRLQWAHLDLRVQMLMPWITLKQGPSPPGRNLLSEYLSPILPKVIRVAIKEKHWPVLIATAGHLLLSLMTVFVTGLFMPLNVRIENPGVALMTTDRFDGSGFLQRVGVDSRMAYTVFGVKEFGLNYPPSTTPDFAVQSFNPQEGDSDIQVITGIVDVFSADLECETGQLDYTVDWMSYLATDDSAIPSFYVESSEPAYIINITTPTCEIRNTSIFAQNVMLEIPNEVYVGAAMWESCSQMPAGDEANRLVIMLGLSQGTESNEPIIKPSYPEGPPRGLNLKRFSHAVCKPTYMIEKALVTRNITSLPQSDGLIVKLVGDNMGNRTLPEISPWHFVEGLFNAMSGSQRLRALFHNETIEASAFIHLLTLLHPNRDISALLEPKTLEAHSRELFRALSGQLAKAHLMVPAVTNFTGTATYNKRRIFIQPLSLWALQAILVVLVLCTLLLLKALLTRITPRDPDSIGALAATISRSDSLVHGLEKTGHLRRSEISGFLRGTEYQTVSDVSQGSPQFRVHGTGVEHFEEENRQQSLADVQIMWWLPFVMKPIGMILVVISPLALITALEITNWQSNKYDGLADVHIDGYVQYTWVFIPAAVMLSISLLFSSFGLAIMTTQPYYALHKGGASATDSVLVNYVRMPAIFALCAAIRRRHAAVAAVAMSVIIAPLLTIVVSGLFSPELVPFTAQVEVNALGWFDPAAAIDDQDDIGPGIVANLILESNLSYPQGTYENLVLPDIKIASEPGLSAGKLTVKATSLVVDMTVLQPQLNCTPDDIQDIVIEFTTSEGEPTQIIAISIPIPFNCMPVDNRAGFPDLTIGFDIPAPQNGYFGTAYPTPLGDDCPSLAIVYGKVSPNIVDDLSVIRCSGYVNEVSARTTLVLPHYTINSSQPPVINPSSSKFFSNQKSIYVHQFFSQLNVSTDSNIGALDEFLQVAVSGRDGVPAAEMLSNNGTNTARLISRVQQVYQITMAQYINMQIRSSNASTTARKFNGTVINFDRNRLQQQAISTRVLEGFLASLFICAIIAYSILHTRHVIPKNPYSIATVASLVAGSTLIEELKAASDPVAHGAEELEKESRIKRVFEGKTFSLGWWLNEDGSRKRFGIDIGLPDARP